jgi:hypothetical protein
MIVPLDVSYGIHSTAAVFLVDIHSKSNEVNALPEHLGVSQSGHIQVGYIMPMGSWRHWHGSHRCYETRAAGMIRQQSEGLC